MSEHLPPLDDSLRVLLDAERAAPLRPDLAEMKARSRERVLSRISRGGPGGGGSAPTSGSQRAWWMGLGGAMGLAAGFLGGIIAAAIAGSLLVTPQPVVIPLVQTVLVPHPVEIPAALPPPHAPPPLPEPVPLRDNAERMLVEQARVALLKGDAQEALVTLMGHERRFPDGTLVEEREVLMIQSLTALGRNSEAAARAEAFRARFPRSIHLPALHEP